MSNTVSTSNKLDAVLAKVDDLLKSRDLQETKLNSILEKLSNLESSQRKTAADVDALKDSYRSLDAQMIDVDNELTRKASREELASVYKKMEYL
jgi:DNA repair ATPase RecN